jgi:hypothetical protein
MALDSNTVSKLMTCARAASAAPAQAADDQKYGSEQQHALKGGHLRLGHAPWLDLRRQITILVHRRKYIDQGLREFLGFCGMDPPEY